MNEKSERQLPIISLESLLKLYDEAFVRAAYDTILGRAVDQGGLDNYLSQIRSGREKSHIVAELALSSEGAQQSASVEGISQAIAEYSQREPSIWARAFRRLASASIESVARQLRVVDNRLYLIEKGIEQQSRLISELNTLVKQGGLSTSGQERSGAAASLVVHAPPLSYLSPRIGRTYARLKAMISLKRAQ